MSVYKFNGGGGIKIFKLESVALFVNVFIANPQVWIKLGRGSLKILGNSFPYDLPLVMIKNVKKHGFWCVYM